MIPLGVLGGAHHPAVDPTGVIVLHETVDCGINHALPVHSAAGHTAIGTWADANGYMARAAGLVAAATDGYNPYALADVGGTDMSIEARIIGRTLSDRNLGFTLGSTVLGSQLNAGAALVICGASDVNGAPYPAGTDIDDFHALATLVGGRLTVSIDGTQVIDTTAPATASGTLCGLSSNRARWLDTIGYDDIIIRRL